MDRCGECGFAYEVGAATGVGPLLVAAADDVAAILGEPDTDVRSRRSAETWSPLEYACHLRDVLLVQRERVLAARRVVRPSFEPMGRDERVEHDGYADQDPSAVGRQLVDAAGMLANVLARLGPDDWGRSVVYNYPRTSERSLRWVAVHTLHELRHHTLDIRRQLT